MNGHKSNHLSSGKTQIATTMKHISCHVSIDRELDRKRASKSFWPDKEALPQKHLILCFLVRFGGYESGQVLSAT